MQDAALRGSVGSKGTVCSESGSNPGPDCSTGGSRARGGRAGGTGTSLPAPKPCPCAWLCGQDAELPSGGAGGCWPAPRPRGGWSSPPSLTCSFLSLRVAQAEEGLVWLTPMASCPEPQVGSRVCLLLALAGCGHRLTRCPTLVWVLRCPPVLCGARPGRRPHRQPPAAGQSCWRGRGRKGVSHFWAMP